MQRPFLPVLLLSLVLLAAGCIGSEDAGTQEAAAATTDAPAVQQASANGSAAASANTTPGPNSTAGGNTTTSANATQAEDMPSNPGNCMRGMDMPGCTSAQAEAAYQARMANYTAPPPDKELPPVVIVLDAQGSNTPGAFTVDAGTMILLVELYLNDTGEGPYLAVGPDGAGDLMLHFAGPSGTTSIPLGGQNVGVNPVSPLADKRTTRIELPETGDWSITLDGQGTNAQVEIRLIERFYA